MRQLLSLILALSLVHYTAVAGAPKNPTKPKLDKYDYAYRGLSYFWYTSKNVGQFLRRTPLKNKVTKQTILEFAERNAVLEQKLPRMQWDSKKKTVTYKFAKRQVKLSFDTKNTDYVFLDGKKVKIEGGASTQKTLEKIFAMYKPSPGKTSLFNFLVPEVEAQGIGVLEAFILSVLISLLITETVEVTKEEIFDPAVCPWYENIRDCWRSNQERLRVLLGDEFDPIMIRSFECRDRNLVNVAFQRERSGDVVEFKGTFEPTTEVLIGRVRNQRIMKTVPGRMTSFSIESYYTTSPDTRTQCRFEIDSNYQITRAQSVGERQTNCRDFSDDLDSVLRIQAGARYPIDLMLSCCHEPECEAAMKEEVGRSHLSPSSSDEGSTTR